MHASPHFYFGNMLKKMSFALALILLAAILLPNLRSLYEGIFFYLRDTVTYSPIPRRAIQRDGRYGSIYDLVQFRNADRQAYILKQLAGLQVSVTQIPIPGSTQTSILVRFSDAQPLTIISAHYDKLFDEIDYQGASDNTAAVGVLLAAVKEIAKSGTGGTRAFLFTGEEERGLRGSQAFVEYARDAAHPIAIRENINFDNVGRGKLAIRPSASVPGFIFTIPFVGDYGYDGREFRASPPYPLAPTRLAQSVVRAQPETTVFEKFTALSDSNVFQGNGIETVAISGDNIPYLERTWHTFADRVELLDENNLDLAYDLIVKYSARN
jgi:Zn-dependent M28 family amino/carboxypeptidase